ncbi:MAG: GHKL domain-containing protein [Lachnospiraceae bacterium]|nr:GHKL domain-containing protein [Lachnospiraceae bacterium]
MIGVIQGLILTTLEAIGCFIFFDIFLVKRSWKKWLNCMLFGLLTVGFFIVSLIIGDSYFTKIMVGLIAINVIMSIYYRNKIFQIVFLSVGFYALLFAIDYTMMIIFQFVVKENIWHNPVQATILALLCKAILLFSIISLSRKLKKEGNLNQIKDSEWIRFLFFPIVTIISLVWFAIGGVGNTDAVLFVSFGLVIANFIIFFIIRDIVKKEKTIQNIRLSQERAKNNMNMYSTIVDSYYEQRKKVHDFKNHIGCIQELLGTKMYDTANEYVNSIYNDWKIEINYYNTNNAIINAVINQKYKMAKAKGIMMILSLNDLSKVSIKDDDIVVILSNMLDNAIEACAQIDEGEKIIKFQFHLKEDKITILMRNPVNDNIKIVNNQLVSTKSKPTEHGIGMKNIEAVVNKYGGECNYSCNHGFFTHVIEIN